VLLAERDGRAQSLVGEVRRQADVDDGDVRPVLGDGLRRDSASPTAATTSWPRIVRSWTSPSRRMAVSSAMTMRMDSVLRS
jgi:hypothetical protein